MLITATDADGKGSTRTLTLNYNATASTSYIYDLRGNLVQKNLHTDPLEITPYTYDALNRLTAVESTVQGLKSKVSYKYDPERGQPMNFRIKDFQKKNERGMDGIF